MKLLLLLSPWVWVEDRTFHQASSGTGIWVKSYCGCLLSGLGDLVEFRLRILFVKGKSAYVHRG